jgi:hypothetical protein
MESVLGANNALVLRVEYDAESLAGCDERVPRRKVLEAVHDYIFEIRPKMSWLPDSRIPSPTSVMPKVQATQTLTVQTL